MVPTPLPESGMGQEWIDAIREHVSDLDELARRGDALREYVNGNWMLEDNLDVWLKAWLPSHDGGKFSLISGTSVCLL